MDRTTISLFNSFPRDIRIPRRKVWSLYELKREIQRGAKHVAIYDSSSKIDKVLIEIDSPSVDLSLEKTREVVLKIESEDLAYIPLFSGRRGFHIYIPFRDFKPPNRETGKVMVGKVQEFFGAGYVDELIVGAMNHMIRIPNTLHEKSSCYCTYLPYEFTGWRPREVVIWSKIPHHLGYETNEKIDIREYVSVEGAASRLEELEKLDIEQHNIPKDVMRFLSGLIRPCLLEEVNGGNPCHALRGELVAELRHLGYDSNHICEVIRKLNWNNYNPRITRYHVKKIQKMNPMSCRRLSQFVDCKECDFGYPWRVKINEGWNRNYLR